MDQHGEKEGEKKSQDSTAVAVAAAAAEGDSEESMDQGEGYKAEESAGLLLIKEVSSEEASPPSPALFAHPCSLLQLLLRACAGCLGLHGYCSGADPKAAAVVAPPPEEAAVAAAADSSQDAEGGEKANDFYMQGEVLTRVLVVRRPRPPSERPREGGGANGGQHH